MLNYVFQCFLIGETALIKDCAQILHREGHTILGISSSNKSVLDWAVKNKIKTYEKYQTFCDVIEKTEFDFLFSIVNRYIIPTKLIKRAKRFVINYHDSLLPRFAGVHAAAWAILESAEQHGITWHVVTEVTDGGPILKQSVVPITEE